MYKEYDRFSGSVHPKSVAAAIRLAAQDLRRIAASPDTLMRIEAHLDAALRELVQLEVST